MHDRGPPQGEVRHGGLDATVGQPSPSLGNTHPHGMLGQPYAPLPHGGGLIPTGVYGLSPGYDMGGPIKKKRKYKARERKHPVPFLSRLVEMFEQEPDHIQWRDGDIIIPDPKQLETKLSTYFRHGNYNSFLRQLNNFGYNKVEVQNAPYTLYVKVQGEKVSTIGALLALRPRERKPEFSKNASGFDLNGGLGQHQHPHHQLPYGVGAANTQHPQRPQSQMTGNHHLRHHWMSPPHYARVEPFQEVDRQTGAGSVGWAPPQQNSNNNVNKEQRMLGGSPLGQQRHNTPRPAQHDQLQLLQQLQLRQLQHRQQQMDDAVHQLKKQHHQSSDVTSSPPYRAATTTTTDSTADGPSPATKMQQKPSGAGGSGTTGFKETEMSDVEALLSLSGDKETASEKREETVKSEESPDRNNPTESSPSSPSTWGSNPFAFPQPHPNELPSPTPAASAAAAVAAIDAARPTSLHAFSPQSMMLLQSENHTLHFKMHDLENEKKAALADAEDARRKWEGLRKCLVCNEAPRLCFMSSCGHSVVCASCAKQRRVGEDSVICPRCGVPVDDLRDE